MENERNGVKIAASLMSDENLKNVLAEAVAEKNRRIDADLPRNDIHEVVKLLSLEWAQRKLELRLANGD